MIAGGEDRFLHFSSQFRQISSHPTANAPLPCPDHAYSFLSVVARSALCLSRSLLLPANSLSDTEFQKPHGHPPTERAASYFTGLGLNIFK